MRCVFDEYHPFCCLCYYIAVIILAATIKAPSFLLMMLLVVVGVNYGQDGGKSLKSYWKAYLLMACLMMVLNPLFSHRGQTVLGYLGENAITLESMLYGMSAAMSLLVIVWIFVSFSLILTGDKFLYLFGRIARQSALVAMMALAFVPRLRQRIDDLAVVQRTRGSALTQGRLKERGSKIMDMLSALVAWSLEDGAMMAQSMTARGYGVKRCRSAYIRYRWQRRDTGFMLLLLGLLLMAVVVWMMLEPYFTIYPKWQPLDYRQPLTGLGVMLCALLVALPLLVKWWDGIMFCRWQRRHNAQSRQKEAQAR